MTMKRVGFAACFLAALVVLQVGMYLFPPNEYANANRETLSLISEARAQNPPIPNGAVAVTSASSSITGTQAGPGTIMAANPGSSLRNYIYELGCINTSGTASVAAVWDSSAIGASPGVQLVTYVNCAPSGASAGTRVFANPIRLRPGSAVGMNSLTAVSQAFFTYQGFTAR